MISLEEEFFKRIIIFKELSDMILIRKNGKLWLNFLSAPPPEKNLILVLEGILMVSS